MKKKITLTFCAFLFCLSFFSCGVSNETNNSERVYDSLVDYLRTLPGVRVNGGGNNARVFITTGGHNTNTVGSTPLFVQEGQQIGSSLRRAMQVIDHNEIKRARVIKPGEATVRYGINGSNGAIEFFMKK